MITAVDIGNSNVTASLIDDDGNIHNIYKIPTARINVYSAQFIKYFNSVPKSEINNILISSVVPKTGNLVSRLFNKQFNITPYFITSRSKLQIKLMIKDHTTLGADRICNAVAGYELMNRKKDVIVVDFGTAITYDVILKDGEFLGGLILPGIETMFSSLKEKTGKLPLIKTKNLQINGKLIGTNTDEAIKYGVLNTITESFNGIISKIIKQYNTRFNVIITGGDSRLISKRIKIKFIAEDNLVLKGIYYIAKHNEFI